MKIDKKDLIKEYRKRCSSFDLWCGVAMDVTRIRMFDSWYENENLMTIKEAYEQVASEKGFEADYDFSKLIKEDNKQ